MAVMLPIAGLPASVVRVAAASSITSAPRFFPETNQMISGRFREVWEAGGLYIYGLPLTRPFTFPSTDGKPYQVQFFERAVFELHPENAAPNDVLLRLLGDELATTRRGDAPFLPVPAPDDASIGYASQTRHTLAGIFHTWWDRSGGLSMFGYPISEAFDERNQADGRTYRVQYFERVRMEWHPDFAGSDHEVELGLLGRERLARASVPAWARQPAPVTSGGVSAAGYPFLAGPHVGLGIQAHFFGQPHDRLFAMINDLGFGWAKQQIMWNTIEGQKGQYTWSDLDALVADAQAANIRLVFSVAKGPAWATPNGSDGLPRDPHDFGNFMHALAARYQGQVAAYELWNEANLVRETSGPIDPDAYVEIVKAGYLGVKSADPDAITILGAPSPTGVNDPNLAIDDTVFLEQLFQYHNGEVRDYYDVLGAHPYGMANPPETLQSAGNPGPGPHYYEHDSFYFRRCEAYHRIMDAHGDGAKQVWFTEWGWGSDFRPDGYDQFNTVTEEMRADYEVRAIKMSRERYPWVGVTLLWNLNWSTIEPWYTGPSHYSIINADGSPRPAYTALKALPK